MIKKLTLFFLLMLTFGLSAQAYTKTYYYPARQNKAYIVSQLDQLASAKKDHKWSVEKIKIISADDYVLNYTTTATQINIDAEIRYEIHPKFLKMTIEKVRLYNAESSVVVESDSEEEEYQKMYKLVKRAYVDAIVDFLSKAD